MTIHSLPYGWRRDHGLPVGKGHRENICSPYIQDCSWPIKNMTMIELLAMNHGPWGLTLTQVSNKNAILEVF